MLSRLDHKFMNLTKKQIVNDLFACILNEKR